MKIHTASVSDAKRISVLVYSLSTPFLLAPSGEGAEPFFDSVSESSTANNIQAPNFSFWIAESNFDVQ